MRPDPLRTGHPVSGKRRTRFSASYLRGVRLLPKGIFPAARMRATSVQSIATGTVTVLNFDTVDYDSPGDDGGSDTDALMASIANEKLTIRYAGLYVVSAMSGFASNNAGYRTVFLRLNGSVLFGLHQLPPVDGSITVIQSQVIRHFDVDDTIEALVFQTSGGALNTDVSNEGVLLSAAWVAL